MTAKQTYWKGQVLVHLTNVRHRAAELQGLLEEDGYPGAIRRKAHDVGTEARSLSTAAAVFEALIEK